MATPSFQCLPRWLPPPPYLCYAQGMGNLYTELEEQRPGGQVLTALPPQSALAKISILAHSKEGSK